MKNHDPNTPPQDCGLHLEQVCFERVFDAPYDPVGIFSFEAQGRRQFGLDFCGSPVPRVGARFAVVLAESGNWQTVLGCRDLATPDVYLGQTIWGTVADLAWIGYFALPVLCIVTLMMFGGWASLAVLAFSVFASVAYLRHVHRRSRTVERMLRAASPPVPPGAGRDPQPTWGQRISRALPTVFPF